MTSKCRGLCETLGKNHSKIVGYPDYCFCKRCHKWFKLSNIQKKTGKTNGCPCCKTRLRYKASSKKWDKRILTYAA